MNIIQIYAIVADDIFFLLMFIKDFSFIQQVFQSFNIIIFKYFTYSLIVQRYRLLKSWNFINVLL